MHLRVASKAEIDDEDLKRSLAFPCCVSAVAIKVTARPSLHSVRIVKKKRVFCAQTHAHRFRMRIVEPDVRLVRVKRAKRAAVARGMRQGDSFGFGHADVQSVEKPPFRDPVGQCQ